MIPPMSSFKETYEQHAICELQRELNQHLLTKELGDFIEDANFHNIDLALVLC